ncbi:hypothetical protein SVAN01_09474 [Stagonosporopsis vannaccii]|nr:hypothetical protein SVAN01_09474 [Stagonosporopsis vannaccii]
MASVPHTVMHNPSNSKVATLPDGLANDKRFNILVRSLDPDSGEPGQWKSVLVYTTKVAEANITRNEFNMHTVVVASVDVAVEKTLESKIRYHVPTVHTATVRPTSLDAPTNIDDGNVSFRLEKAVDVMLEINGDERQALHLLVNVINPYEGCGEAAQVWCFGPGVNNGCARDRINDGKLLVPSNTIVYLASGAFLTAQLVFMDVENSLVKSPGFIFRDPYNAGSSTKPKELAGGVILTESSRNITVEGVTVLLDSVSALRKVMISTLTATAPSPAAGIGTASTCSAVKMSLSSIVGCATQTIPLPSTVTVGGTMVIQKISASKTARYCQILLILSSWVHMAIPKPETLSNIHVSNINLLDHLEDQVWYQGRISIDAGDENLIQDVLVEDVLVERITKRQLINIRVMKNAMWTTAPGRGVRNVTFRNLELRRGYPEQ